MVSTMSTQKENKLQTPIDFLGGIYIYNIVSLLFQYFQFDPHDGQPGQLYPNMIHLDLLFRSGLGLELIAVIAAMAGDTELWDIQKLKVETKPTWHVVMPMFDP